MSHAAGQPGRQWAAPALLAASLAAFTCSLVLVLLDAPASWWLAPLPVGLMLCYLAQTALVAEHLGAVLRSAALDGACAAAAHSALLITVLHSTVRQGSGITSVAATLALINLACAVTVTGMAVVTVALARSRLDVRLVWLSAAGFLVGAIAVATLARIVGLVEVPGGALLTMAVLVLLLLAAAAVAARPVPSLGLRSHPRVEVVAGLLAAAECVLVLVVADQRPVPVAAVAAACVGLLAVALKVALLVLELQVLHGFHRAALVDDLTSLPNRSGVRQRLDQLRALGWDGVLIVIGVDRFRDFNDVVGHGGGDLLLRALASRFAGIQRPGEFLARHSGDEFSFVVPRASAQVAQQRAMELLAVLVEPVAVEGHLLHVQARAAVIPLNEGTGPVGNDEVVRRGEAVLNALKAGSQRMVTYEESLHVGARRRVQVGAALRSALEQEQFVLHYQPQLDARGRVAGVEALVRWHHISTGLVPPDDFLPLVQELGLQSRLTRWVLSMAIRQGAVWRRQGRCVPVAVNLSVDDVVPELVDAVAAELLACDLPADQLLVELTETTLVTDPARVAGVLGSLVELGVRVSIDDYGTGYSSLILLLRLPVAELKIDKVFIAGMLTDPRSRVVVETTVQLAHRLGLRVVAEGVEDEEVLAAVHAAGCDLTQGWVHHPAVPAVDLERWMDQRGERCLAPSVEARN